MVVFVKAVVEAAMTAETRKVRLVVEGTLFSLRNNYQIQEANTGSKTTANFYDFKTFLSWDLGHFNKMFVLDIFDTNLRSNHFLADENIKLDGKWKTKVFLFLA